MSNSTAISDIRNPFYGWRVVAAATFGLALGFSNIGTLSFGLFVIPLSDNFGWSRGNISVAFLIMNYTLVLFAPLLGLLIDRFGVRRVLLPSIIFFSCVVAGLALLTENIAHFYFMYVLFVVAGIGTTPSSYTRVIIAWFDRRRGLAVGVAMAGVGAGGVFVPPYVQYLILHYGWQAGYLGLSALIILTLPIVYFFLIENPERVGQFPDGAAQEKRAATKLTNGAVGYPFRQCLRHRSFWLMVVGFVLLGIMTHGLLTHLVPLLQDRGISAENAALGASTLALALVIGRIVCGLLFDYFHASHVVTVFLLGPVVGLLMLALGASGGWAYFAVLLVGLGIGGEFDFMTYLTSRYLGQLSYGQIYGLLYAVFTLGGGLGAVLMGYGQEINGDYSAGLWLLFGAALVSMLPFSRLGPYPRLPFHTKS